MQTHAQLIITRNSSRATHHRSGAALSPSHARSQQEVQHLGLVPRAVAPRRARAILTTTIPPSSSSCGPHAGVACRRYHSSRHASWRARSCAWQIPGRARIPPRALASQSCAGVQYRAWAHQGCDDDASDASPTIPARYQEHAAHLTQINGSARTGDVGGEKGGPFARPSAVWAAAAARCWRAARHAHAARLKF